MGALSPFPEKLNPGADKTPGLGILLDKSTRLGLNYDFLQEALSKSN